jgi:putative ABC transport system ATP-binding protein
MRSAPGCDDARISEALFTFDRVTVAGADRPRLVEVTAEIPCGVVTVIVGPSGAGKSTLLRLCNRLEVPDSGVVRFHADDVAGVDPLALRRKVGMVFQRPTPFPGTVIDNLRVAEPALTERAAGLALERVKLEPSMLWRDAAELSGGEAQRMCLARTLVTRPEVVLLDEPTSSVDPAARQSLEALAPALNAVGVTAVWVTHDLEQMRRIADRVLVVIDGRVAHAGPVSTLDDEATGPVASFLAGEAA